MNVLLDTCAIIFFSQPENELSKAAWALFEDPTNDVFVSAVSAGELACAQQRGRVNLTDHWKSWFRQKIELNLWNLLPISLEIMEEAWSLPEPIHRDPAD
jgi:PIN domain nuclease of toxin-antitoxin system